MSEYLYTKDDDYILSEEEQFEIVEWVKKNYLRFRQTGENRYMRQMDLFDDIPKCVWDIKERIVKKEKLEDAIQEPMFRDAIGYMFEGGQLHKHTDPNLNGLIHTRFNVYVQIPKKGGYPVYRDEVILLKERTYVCCRSGLDLHYCQLVEGDRARIIISYGFLLPKERVSNIKYLY